MEQLGRHAQAVAIFVQIALACVQAELMTLATALRGAQFFGHDFKAFLLGARDDVDHPRDGVRSIKR